VIIHNIIIDSELDAPVVGDQPFDHQGHLAQLDDQVPTQLVSSSPCTKKSTTEMSIINFKLIQWSIFGQLKETLNSLKERKHSMILEQL
jgi:hypothetical protein